MSSENGLSHDSTTSIIQDQFGLIWIGTTDGLNRFDGYNFEIFKHDPSKPNSLSHNWIRTLIQDRTGIIWIGTNNGLNSLDPGTGQIKHYFHNKSDNSTIIHNNILSLMEDSRGTLWVGTVGGLNRYNPADETFSRINTRELSYSAVNTNIVIKACQQLFEDSKGRIWIVSNKIYQIDQEKNQLLPIDQVFNLPPEFAVETFSNFFEDSRKNIWFITQSQGIIRYNTNSGEYNHYKKQNRNEKGLSDNSVKVIYETSTGTLWIGTIHRGLNRYDWEKDNFICYRHDQNNPNSLSGDAISTIFEDNNGMLWIGNYGRGLTKIIREKKTFTPVRHDPDNTHSLSDNSVHSFFMDKSESLWVGTERGLNRWDESGKRFIRYLHNPKDSFSIGNNTIKSIVEDKFGRLWFGSNNGLSRYDRKMNKFHHLIHRESDPSSLSSNRVRSLYKDKSGILWIGTTGGLNRFDYQAQTFTRFTHDPQDPSTISHNNILPILEDHLGNLWIGTLEEGLNILDRKTGKFTHFKTSSRDKNSLSSNCVICLHEDNHGDLWIGTIYGLNKFNRDTRTFSRFFDDENGLPNNTIYGILSDEDGYLWVSTNRGLAKFNPETARSRNYFVSDGLQNNEFNGNAYHRDKTGRFYFGGIQGYNVFFPRDIIDESIKAKMIFLSFRVIREGQSRIQPTTDFSTIQLSPSKKTFTIEFASLDYRYPEKNQYAYKLENFNEEWNYIGNRHFSTYTNLDPGEYIFRVKGTNNKGIWNDSTISLKIIVLPPFWKTWWFLSLTSLSILIFIISLYKRRINLLKNHRKELENLVNLRTAELQESNHELEKLSIVVRETDDAILITDARGTFIWVNEGFKRMFGITLEQMKEKGMRNIYRDSTHPNIKEIIQTCIEKNRSVSYESHFTKKNGETIWTQTSLTPHFDSDGKLLNLVAIESDITEIREARSEADKANRSKSDFLTRMSHEILTPMNGIIGFTDMLLNSELNESQEDYARTIYRSSEILVFLLNDILDFSKLHTGDVTLKSTDFDPEITIFNICDLVLPKMRDKSIEIICRIGDQVPAWVNGDVVRYRQVLFNLLENAVKYTEEGEIIVSLTSEEQEDKITLITEVSDTGKGIAENKIDSIFDVFQQAEASTARKYGFPGLGLFISKKISNLMDGDIQVESKLGEGSTFRFTCKVSPPKKMIHPTEAKPSLSGKHILIVENKSITRELLSEIILSSKAQVSTTSNVKDVIPLIKNSFDVEHPVDLCIIETQIENNSGYSLARKIRNLDGDMAEIPLLAITSPLLASTVKHKESDFSGFLPKPIQKRILIRIIEKLLDQNSKTQSLADQSAVITQHRIIEEDKHSLHILLVDDNAINLKLATMLLKKGGYQVTSVHNGEEAVNTFLSDPRVFNLIFMDIQMPVMNGREATRLIRSKGFNDIPIVAMTAETMDGDREKCLEAGMDDYIPKPIKRELVYKIIKKWCLSPKQ